jgi:hypothetical protein
VFDPSSVHVIFCVVQIRSWTVFYPRISVRSQVDTKSTFARRTSELTIGTFTQTNACLNAGHIRAVLSRTGFKSVVCMYICVCVCLYVQGGSNMTGTNCD